MRVAGAHTTPLALQIKECMALYERALAIAPRRSETLYNMGVALVEAGQHERAVFL